MTAVPQTVSVRVPLAIRNLTRIGQLADPEGSGVYVGFLAGIIAHGPAALRVAGAHIRAQSPGSVSSVPYARPRMS